MKGKNIIESYLLLSKAQKKYVNIAAVVILLFILYIVVFYICKGVLTDKAKTFMVEKGIGSSKDKIELKVNVDPFTWFSGKVHKLDLYVDIVKVKDITYIHNVEIHTKSFNFRKIKSIEEGLYVGANIGFCLNESDFLILLNDKFKYKFLDIKSENGNIIFETSFGNSVSARPYLLNNCIYLDFDMDIFNYPIKIIDFGMLTKNRLNIYEFNYSGGSYNFKGTLI